MKKKIISCILLILMLYIFIGCGKQQPVESEQDNQGTNLEEHNTENILDTETDNSKGIEVEKNLMTVEVTLPSDFIGDLTDFDEEEYLSQNVGIKSAKVNDDGSLTLTMSKSKHNEMMEGLRKNVDESIGELIEGENTPYIKSIDYTDDYREVYIGVVKQDYENSFDLTPFMIGFSTSMYQSISGIEIKTTIIINDVSTGEEIASVIYPDAWMEE